MNPPVPNIIELLCPRQRWAGHEVIAFVTCFQRTPEFLRTEYHILSSSDGVEVQPWSVGTRPLALGPLGEAAGHALAEAKRQAHAYVDKWTRDHTTGMAKAKGEVLDCTLETIPDSALRTLKLSPAWATALSFIASQTENPSLHSQLTNPLK